MIMEASELDALVQQLAGHDWRLVRRAAQALVESGKPGLAAVLRGLDDHRPRVRRGCLDFLDHHASTLCINNLRRLALNDPVADVRRAAVHAIACVRCKPEPLDESGIDFVASVALHDPSRKVRRAAVSQLGDQSPNARAAEALTAVLNAETEYDIRRQAHLALRHHSPEYRHVTDTRARELATARTAQSRV